MRLIYIQTRFREILLATLISILLPWDAVEKLGEVKTEIRQNRRFTVAEVEAFLAQLSQDEREFGEE